MRHRTVFGWLLIVMWIVTTLAVPATQTRGDPPCGCSAERPATAIASGVAGGTQGAASDSRLTPQDDCFLLYLACIGRCAFVAPGIAFTACILYCTVAYVVCVKQIPKTGE